MFKTHLKIALRVLTKDRVFTAINILGLSAGLAITFLIILYARFEFGYEQHNPLSDQIVRLTMDYLDNGTLIDQDAETYPLLGPMIKNEIPEVKDFARAQSLERRSLKVNGKYYNSERNLAVDPVFLPMMHAPLTSGNENDVLKEPNQVVLTEGLAMKIFDRLDIIGEVIEISSFEKSFAVVGLIKDAPVQTHLKYDMLVSFLTLDYEVEEHEESWNTNNMYTYLLLNNSNQSASFSKNLSAFSKRLTAEEKLPNERVVSQPIKEIHLYSNKSYEPEANGNASSVFILLGVALLVIIIAIVNYINLATARSLDRAKEVGIRKVVGSTLGQLRLQFFTESFLINAFASVYAVIFMAAALQQFRNVANLPESFNFLNDSFFWMTMAIVMVVSTLLSGVFPAFILSAFQPVSVLKGRFSQSVFGIYLRKGLVIFQFAITTFLLIQTLTVKEQLGFLRSMDLGVNLERTVVVESPNTEEYKQHFKRFKDQLKLQPQVQSVSLSTCVPGLPTSEMGSTTGINLSGATEEHNFNFYIYFIDADFLSTMGMNLLAGENFQEESKNEDRIIVNEETIRLWGIPSAAEAIGKQVRFWGSDCTIVGVVQNFHQMSAKSAHIPLIFRFTDEWHLLASVKLSSGEVDDHIRMIGGVFKSTFPNSPFSYYFLDEEFNKQYAADQRFHSVFRTLSAFAILIACLGLFGLISFSISRRGKEIGIRKVLGASIAQIIGLLSRDFMKLIVISIFIAMPITYFLVERWLRQYAYRIEISPWLFVLAAIIIFGLSLVTLILKTYRFSRSHPAESMRDE